MESEAIREALGQLDLHGVVIPKSGKFEIVDVLITHESAGRNSEFKGLLAVQSDPARRQEVGAVRNRVQVASIQQMLLLFPAYAKSSSMPTADILLNSEALVIDCWRIEVALNGGHARWGSN